MARWSRSPLPWRRRTVAGLLALALVAPALLLSSSITALGRGPVLTVVGDSYMAGTGSRRGPGMAEVLAQSLDVQLVNLAEGGTGWADDGREDRGYTSFDEDAEQVLASDPDLVVVAGGFNDHSSILRGLATYAEVRASARRLLPQLAGATGVRTVVVGPFWLDESPPASLLRLRDVVREEAARAGVEFVDPVAQRWVTGLRSGGPGNAAVVMQADGIHPTRAGHRYLGERVARAVATSRAAGPGQSVRAPWGVS